jgi:FAD-dependent oxidoreductase domain-containing protein 1
MDSLRAKYDVMIAGGGIVGCYVAYFLKQRNPGIESGLASLGTPLPDCL